MLTGDGAYIKKINRSLILNEIIKHNFISRAELSKTTGLNKATISVQVSDLLDDELICETRQEHQAIGRRPIMLSINGKAGNVLGVDLDFPFIQFTISDLSGMPVEQQTLTINTEDYNKILSLLIQEIKEYKLKYSGSKYGLISAIIGIHGTVNKDATINFVPTFNWHQQDLKADLEKELDITINIENNANLSAYAEKVYIHHQCDNLLTVILSSGIGAGTLIDGKLHKGHHGYAGELGHMIISPDGKSCACGNQGCWERYASERILFKELSDLLKKQNLDYEDLKALIDKQDPTTHEYIKQFIKYLSIGLNNIINFYNPETIVLNSKLLRLYPSSIEEIKHYLTSSVSRYRDIVLSELDNRACVLGACALAIERFFEVPDLTLDLPENSISNVNENTEKVY